MYQPVPGSDETGLDIEIDGLNPAKVEKFKYLGSTVCTSNKMDEELKTRLSNASTSFGRLKDKVWFNKDLTFKTKCAVYRAIVMSSLLYGSESWPVHKVIAHRLNSYMMRHLRLILNVKWWGLKSNQKILDQAGLDSMYDVLIQRNLRWVGHVNRMDNTRLPKQILYSQLRDGLRGVGRPRLRLKDCQEKPLGQRHRSWWLAEIGVSKGCMEDENS